MKTNTNLLMSAVIWAAGMNSFGQPLIITQPQNQTNLAGGTVTFSVGATGMPPVTYQWRVYTNVTAFADLIGETNSTLVLTNVQPTTLLYGVVVTDPDGFTNSILAQLIVFPVNLPPPPKNIMAAPGDRQITVSWQAVPEATSYIVKRASTSSGVASVVANNLAATSFVNTNLSNGANYYYAVVAVSPNGESPESGRASASPSAAVLDLLPAGAKLEKLATGFVFTEGPVWFSTDGGFLIFSDIDGNKMYKWTSQGTSVFRSPSNKANGNTLDLQGRLVTCEQTTKRVSRTEPDNTVITLVNQYLAKPLNEPNDVVVKSDGTIWFTDPAYNGGSQTQPGRYVYRFDPTNGNGTITAVITNMDQPNGLCFSPDESRLYVSDGSPARQHVRVCDVLPDNSLTSNRVFATVSSSNVPDGMRMDKSGRLFVSVGDGVRVLNTNGQVLGTITTPEVPTNLSFGGTNQQVVFITAGTSLYGITRMPDLVVVAVNRSPASLSAGQAATFSAIVKNQGTGTTLPGAAIRVRFTLNDQNVFWSDPSTEPLPPGGSVLLAWSSSYWTARAGANQLRAEVDAANEILESIETNNITLTNFTVAAAGPDSDGDGMSDASENTAGTEPLNSGSALRILSGQFVSPSDFVLTWTSIPWKRYRIVSRNQLTDFQWTEASGDIRATSTTTFWTNTISGTNGLALYRVLVFSN